MRLQGERALVTGAGSGIGRAIAMAFAREGARVVAADVDEAAAAETAALTGGLAFRCDVSEESQVEALMAFTVSHLGGVDILVNNAGIGTAGKVHETATADWDRQMNVNARGCFLGCKYVIPVMLAQGRGRIINIASVAGMVGIRDRAAYCASKGAVIALTRNMAVDYATTGIRVNALCPGTVDSPWIAKILAGSPDPEAARQAMAGRQPIGRMGTPEEVAAAAVYLASPEADFVHGACLVIDGGLTAG
jgi:NAD(P)-dependent dehydrogenase (short-subunit alcohol dehydrogenase family)